MFTETYTPLINGVVTSVRGLSQTLRQQGYRVTVVAPYHPNQEPEEDVFRLPSTVYPPIPEQRMILPPSIRKWARLSRLHFDLIHTHGAFPILGLACARTMGLPLVHTYHTRMRDYVHYYPWYPYIAAFSDESKWYMTHRASARIRRQLDKRTISIAGRFDTWFSNQCSALITPTEVIAHELRDMGVHRPIDVIPNGIDVSALRQPKPDPFLNWGIPKGSRLLTVSRLGKEKSVEFLIAQVRAILPTRPDVKLVILGDGPERSSLQTYAKDLGVSGHIVFGGYIPNSDVGAFYQHADVFVFASTTETQGMVALEAAACGLPVVARAAGGIAESLPDGIAGYLVPTQSSERFTQRVLELLNTDAREVMSQKAILWAETGSLETMAQRVLHSYEKAQRHFDEKQRERQIFSENLLD